MQNVSHVYSDTRNPARTIGARTREMARKLAQNLILAVAIALLLATVWRIYQIQLAKAPTNLEGNIATEGGMTANPPAN